MYLWDPFTLRGEKRFCFRLGSYEIQHRSTFHIASWQTFSKNIFAFAFAFPQCKFTFKAYSHQAIANTKEKRSTKKEKNSMNKRQTWKKSLSRSLSLNVNAPLVVAITLNKTMQTTQTYGFSPRGQGEVKAFQRETERFTVIMLMAQ